MTIKPILSALLFLSCFGASFQSQALEDSSCDSQLLVSSWFNNQVKIFNACNGDFIRNLDESGLIKGPLGLLKSDNGNVLVLSEGNDRLIEYSAAQVLATQPSAGKVLMDNAKGGFITKPVGAIKHPNASKNTILFASYDTNAITEVQADTWQISNILVPSNQSEVAGADAGIATDNEYLYVPGYDSDNIMRVELSTGKTDELVKANSAGLDAARSIVIVGDELIVSSERSNAILKFNKHTGEFTGKLLDATRPAHITLDGPEHILLTTRTGVYRVKLSDGSAEVVVKPGTGDLKGATFVLRISAEHNSVAWQEFVKVADYIEDKGDRTAGAPLEKQMADWITLQWQAEGYDVTSLPFDFKLKGKPYSSQNLYIDILGKNQKQASANQSHIIIGAHYDAVGAHSGSAGLIDNGSGVAALLALAKELKGHSLPYTVRLVAFGAEERGLLGAKDYVKRDDVDLDKVIAMVNLDTIIGGDKLYVHSAHSKPYKCDYLDSANYESNPSVREAIRAVSIQHFPTTPHLLHGEYEGYPEGETGSWSDHSPFACSGIPIAYIEATNFAIKGKRGNDGYSQVADKAYWDCFDEKNLTSCNRSDEKAWGEIWHTKFDRKSALFPVMKARLKAQQEQNVAVLKAFVLDADTWLK